MYIKLLINLYIDFYSIYIANITWAFKQKNQSQMNISYIQYTYILMHIIYLTNNHMSDFTYYILLIYLKK